MGPGREAATVRQFVLVVVLVGAAFLGGAFVNGPGLRWVQTQVLGSLGLDDGGEIATVDLKNGPGTDKAGPGETPRGPTAPTPGVVADSEAKPGPSEPPRRVRRDDPDGAGARRPPASAASVLAPSFPDLTASAVPAPPPADDDRREREARPSAPGAGTGTARAPRDPDVTRAAAPSAPAASTATPSPADRDRPREAVPALVDSLASLMPTPAPASPEGVAPAVPMPAPGPSPSPPPASPAPNRPGDDDWATLARKMQALGVTRFTVEGQPGGRANFSCLIPLAGRQAVTQRFEAEGEDALQAARAALRRVALWRAAQPQQSQQPSR
jgi:hypothetical protein